MVKPATVNAHIAPIDEQISNTNRWGYPFGVDGIANLEAACEMFGGISRATLDRRAEEQLIRKGKDRGRVVYCVKSIRDYVASLEM